MSKKSNRFPPKWANPPYAWCVSTVANINHYGLLTSPLLPRLAAYRPPFWIGSIRDEVDTGVRDGVTSEECKSVKALEREVKELRRVNEILKLASAFFDLEGLTAN